MTLVPLGLRPGMEAIPIPPQHARSRPDQQGMGDPELHPRDTTEKARFELAELLALPARGSDSELSPGSRVALRRLLRRAERALRRCLDVPVRVELPERVATEQDSCFATVFRQGDAEWSVLLGSDSRSALLDVFEQALSGHLARAEVDEIERGLLEGVALLLLGELQRGESANHDSSLLWTGCLHGDEAQQHAASLEDAPLPIAVHALGRRITLLVHGHGCLELESTLQALEDTQEHASTLSGALELHATIPALADAELNLLREAAIPSGSVLLLGAQELSELASQLELRNATGWTLGPATLEREHAHALRASLLDLRPAVPPANTPTLRFGSLPLREGALEALAGGASFSFARQGRMHLCLEGTRPLDIELVDYDGELAARIL